MKLIFNSKTLLIVLLASAFLAGRPGYAEQGKYAYVDVAKIFDTYEKTKDRDKVLQDAGKKKEEERDALVYDIRQLKDELALMNGDMKNKKQELLEQKVQALQDFDQNAKKALGEERGKVVKEIFKDIEDAIKLYGQKQGLDFIFNEKALLYQNEKLNATDAILAELNKAYQKK